MMTGVRQRPDQSLAGMRILVVEDEMMVAMMLEDMLTDLGCDVVKAGRVAKAVQFVKSEEIDVAILDVNVAGESVYPVARELRERGIPFVFSTGYGAGGLHPDYFGLPMLSKPFREEDLAPLLADAIRSNRRSGED